MLGVFFRWLRPLNGNAFQRCAQHLEIVAVRALPCQTQRKAIAFGPQFIRDPPVLAGFGSVLIKGPLAEEVSKLKQEVGQDVLIFGSGELVHQLTQQDLIWPMWA